MNSVVRISATLQKEKPAGQLNLATGAGGGQDLAYIIGKITRRIFEYGIPVTSRGKRTLRITRSSKIRMVKQVISFHSNRKLPFLTDRKTFVQRRVRLSKRGSPRVCAAQCRLRRGFAGAWRRLADFQRVPVPFRQPSLLLSSTPGGSGDDRALPKCEIERQRDSTFHHSFSIGTNGDSGPSLAGHYRIGPLVSDVLAEQIGNFKLDVDLRRVEERVLH